MRKISVIVMTVVSVILMIWGCVSNQAPTTGAPKIGKPLVSRLPANIEGVELVGGTVRAKSGYKFVKQPNGSVTVARMAGGAGVGGTWSCTCQSQTGKCSAVVSGDFLYCLTATCGGPCPLEITIEGLRKDIMVY
jgi:hypothetical protein